MNNNNPPKKAIPTEARLRMQTIFNSQVQENVAEPFPTPSERKELINQYNITYPQINKWFKDQRNYKLPQEEKTTAAAFSTHAIILSISSWFQSQAIQSSPWTNTSCKKWRTPNKVEDVFNFKPAVQLQTKLCQWTWWSQKTTLNMSSSKQLWKKWGLHSCSGMYHQKLFICRWLW